jgi:hypothetical protein
VADPKIATPGDTGVLDIALVSGCADTISCDAVCSLLTKWLQDVSSSMLVMLYLFVC